MARMGVPSTKRYKYDGEVHIIPEKFREIVKIIIAVVCSYGPDPVRKHGMSGRSKAAAYL
jgi:hypothetical protein